MGRLAVRGLAVVALALALARPASADSGWSIDRFAAQIAVQPDGALIVEERIDVDFGTLQKHGIFRYVPIRYRYDDTHDRLYDVRLQGVTDAAGTAIRAVSSEQGAQLVVQIGDPNRTVSGKQTYRIRYVASGVLNGFSDHDELYWNVNGNGWGVPTRTLTATVMLPSGGAINSTACFQGPQGSTQTCTATANGASASFVATRALAAAEGVTVGVAFPKGVVADPKPMLIDATARPGGGAGGSIPVGGLERGPDTFFAATPLTLGSSILVFGLGVALVAAGWNKRGRDHVHLKNYYLHEDAAEGDAPLLGRGPAIVPEYEPPDKMRPAEVGLLLDEEADPKDVTATIVDLARRGYLRITELAPKGLFGHRDWELTRTKPADAGLADYESVILAGLFAAADSVTVEELKGKFITTLRRAQRLLYRESVKQGWFFGDPQWTRALWAGLGVLVLIVGGVLAFSLGEGYGWGLVGLAVAAVGLVVLAVSHAMPARTAAGSDLLRRILGFRMYMLAAEVDRAKFAERENIFSDYLPYAIVFGCVEKWVAAFKDLDVEKQVATWYVGPQFGVIAFSNNLATFSSQISTAAVSTPGGRGGSFMGGGGFGGGGGFSGGGGGGGGGGSW